jgi:parallel beta-helix repeat protein
MFDDIAIGDALPVFSRETDFASWNRYAAVNDEFIDVHMSAEAAQAAGQPDVFGMGNLRVAYAHAMVHDWLSGRGDIAQFACQFRQLNFRGDRLSVHARVTGNLSHDNFRYGLHFMFSDSCAYEHNLFTKNGAGVAVMYTKYVVMTGNRFLDNWGPTAYGLLLKEINDSRVEGNQFRGNTEALHLEGSNRVQVLANDFDGNGWAVRLLGNSENDRLDRNRFHTNSFDLTTNTSSTTATLDANEWDQYRGYDLDHDGYGDVPYRPMRLFAVLVQDNEPALILLRSLFIDLLDVAERVLPVLTPQGLVDHRPVVRKATS